MRGFKDGLLTDRETLRWFDERIPQDLPNEAVQALLTAFWDQVDANHLDGEIILHGRDGHVARLECSDRQVWTAQPHTRARYLAVVLAEDLSPEHRDVLSATELRTYDHAMALRKEREQEAEAKAEELLYSLLSPEQRTSWDDHRFVAEPSRLHPGTTYVIKGDERVGNIEILDMPPPSAQPAVVDARAVVCAAPAEDYPSADIVVTQLLNVRGDERRFLQLANLHDGHWSPAEQAVRDERDFVTVPRWDARMGGFIDVPADLSSWGGPGLPEGVSKGYDELIEERRAAKHVSIDEQIVILADELPADGVDRYIDKVRTLITDTTPSPEAEKILAEVELNEDMATLEESLENFATIEDDIRLTLAAKVIRHRILAYRTALGQNGDAPEEPVAVIRQVLPEDDTPAP